MPDVREARERKRARRLHQTCLSRGVREEQLQEASPKRKTVYSEIQERGDARVHDRERQESSEHVKESSVRK